MALSNTEKASVRRYLGYSLLYSQTDPVLEGQFEALATLPDGGATEALIRTYLTTLDAIMTGIATFRAVHEVGSADEATMDVYRGVLGRVREGKMYVVQLAHALNLPVRGDCFGTPTIDRSAGAFPGLRQGPG